MGRPGTCKTRRAVLGPRQVAHGPTRHGPFNKWAVPARYWNGQARDRRSSDRDGNGSGSGRVERKPARKEVAQGWKMTPAPAGENSHPHPHPSGFGWVSDDRRV